MKLYSHAIWIAALAAPAFCQEPAPVRIEPVPLRDLQSVADQVRALKADQVLRGADALQAAQDKLATLDSADLQEKLARAAAQIDAVKDTFNRFELAGPAKIYMPFDSAEIEAKFAQAAARLDEADAKFNTLDLEEASERIAAKAAAMAERVEMSFLQKPAASGAAPVPPTPPLPAKTSRVFAFSGRDDATYDRGTRALDQHQYDQAVQLFDTVITAKSTRADGALYWKAYALNREGKSDDAIAAIAQLRRDYASSAWLNDAQSLEAEVKQNAGQPVSPAQESNDDIRLMAINSLMNADAERAIPLVEGILKGNSAPNVKRNALFVLAQNKSPRAQQVIIEFAKGGGNPDLQLSAIQFVGQSSTKEAQQQLTSIYTSSSDTRVKNAILQALMTSRANDALLSIAKTEKDASLRSAAIRYMASIRSVPVDGLLELYNSGPDAQSKRDIIDALLARRDAKSLVDLARKESDPAMKRSIVERLGTMRDSKEAMDYMIELLK